MNFSNTTSTTFKVNMEIENTNFHENAIFSDLNYYQSLRTIIPNWVLLILSLPVTVIIFLTIFGNLLVLCFKARVGRTNTTLLVWNLGLTDFLVGIIVLPLGAIHFITQEWKLGRILCRLWVGADVTFCTCSVVTICVISVDRYLAVTRPLKYKTVVTKKKVICVMIIIWTFSSCILLSTVRWEQPIEIDNTLCFAGNEIRYLAHSVVFAFFLPASVTLTLYWRIYRLARQRQKALDRGFLMILGQNMNFLTNTITQHTTLRVHIGRKNGMVEHQRRVLRTHERIAKTLGVVSCSFLFCWLPFFMLYLTNYQCSGCIPTIFVEGASWLGYCNSMLNPIIYSFTVKQFKKSALQAILPFWQILYQLLPSIVKPPPEHVKTKISRNVHIKSKNKDPIPRKDNLIYHNKEKNVHQKNPIIPYPYKGKIEYEQQTSCINNSHNITTNITINNSTTKSQQEQINKINCREIPSIISNNNTNECELRKGKHYDPDSITLNSDDEILTSGIMFREDSSRRRSITISDFSNIETLSRIGSDENLPANTNFLFASGLSKNSKSLNLHGNRTVIRLDYTPKGKKKRKNKCEIEEIKIIVPSEDNNISHKKDELRNE
uniref:G_PROTEIN_RECEP_F1_2 domain-containing protein n=1 Tax=Strongyloides venezuelensis TaxID=75913 RepID=A0A0K0F690_STRVS